MSEDRNFDDLFERFRRNIKSGDKGRLREILIREDLREIVTGLEDGHCDVLDVGCGLGDMSVWLAGMGHRVRASDLSAKMVDHTRSVAAATGVSVTVVHESAQVSLAGGEKADLVCLHAVLEWLEEPYRLLEVAAASLKPGGYLSLTVYNLHRSVFNSLVKGNLAKIKRGDYSNHNPQSLSPPHPIVPETVRSTLLDLGLSIELEAGIRCFFDYLTPKNLEEISDEDIIFLERKYRRLSPYRDIARYVHFIAKKP